MVTGAARGIGRMIALRFAQEGANVAFTDLSRDENMETLEKELSDIGVKGKGYVSDASDFDQAQQTVEQVIADFEKVDVLVNNAGITRDTLLLRMRDEDWTQVLDVNLKGAFHFTRAATKYLMKVDNGRIINIASVVGIMGNAGQANYAASKGGLISFTKAVAKELAPRGVTVNAIAPGFIETKMTADLDENAKEFLLKAIPVGRYGKPEEVANGVVFLASELASYVTGHVLVISGGMAM